jgi:hypothetical protein
MGVASVRSFMDAWVADVMATERALLERVGLI